MDIEKLKTELADPKYESMTDDEATDALNAKTIDSFKVLEHPELTRLLAQKGRLARLRRAMENYDDPTKDIPTSIATVAWHFVNRDQSALDAGNPGDVALVNALVASGVFTSEDKDDFIEAATTKISKATELKLGTVNKKHVRWARLEM